MVYFLCPLFLFLKYWCSQVSCFFFLSISSPDIYNFINHVKLPLALASTSTRTKSYATAAAEMSQSVLWEKLPEQVFG